ncbi:MAG: alpha-E domain-containing protein [Chloroflexota bacterium]|nr:alpha-E domain-containing protein [Chloroflexota bacterium]
MTMLSRVADTLYWMSRYLERAEHTTRLLDLQLNMMLESPASAELRWQRILDGLWVKPSEARDAYTMAEWLTFDASHESSIFSCIVSARENARYVREQISSEMWEQVNLMALRMRQSTIDEIWNDQPHEFFRAIKEGCHLFQGITDSTMNHGEGWQFIQLGRYLERIHATARLLDVHYAAFAETPFHQTVLGDTAEWIGLLKSCTAFEAYCKVYTADLRPGRIAEFLLLNAEFPHSIRFSVHCAHAALLELEKFTESKRARQVNRLVGRLRALLDYGQIDEIMGGGLGSVLIEVDRVLDLIHDAIYQTYITYPADEFVS